MDREELNLIVDRIVNAIDKVGIDLDDMRRSHYEAMRRLIQAVEMIHLECEGT